MQQSEDLKAYLVEKWGEGWDFEAPEWFGRGDESAEYFDSYVNAHRTAMSLSNEELAETLWWEILDLHYSNIEWLMTDGRDYYEIAFPELDAIREKWKQFEDEGVEGDMIFIRVVEWAMEWREENEERLLDERRAQRLRDELARIEQRKANAV